MAEAKRLYFQSKDGTRHTLSDDQAAFVRAAIALGTGQEPRPGRVETFTVDGEAMAQKLSWSEAKLKLIAHELGELGMDCDLTSEQPE